jgi:hypothetical protein
MYDRDAHRQALDLINSGHSLRSIGAQTGVSRSTLREWRDRPETQPYRFCPRCAAVPDLPQPGSGYAYLLGLYLGDGCIRVIGDPQKRVWLLRIACADNWPGLREECRRAMVAIRPLNKVRVQPSVGCSYVMASSKHWPCLFPQHGPGPKHLRKIELEPWQRCITNRHPGDFARGLFHSDGCRFVNRVRRPLAGGDRWYEHPRYMFTNESADIRALCAEALDALGVPWRNYKRNTISVARRDAVARLDEFVGPKY